MIFKFIHKGKEIYSEKNNTVFHIGCEMLFEGKIYRITDSVYDVKQKQYIYTVEYVEKEYLKG